MTSKRASPRVLIGVALVLAGMLLLSGCSGSDSDSNTQSETSSLSPTQSNAAEQAIREAADNSIQAINDRDYKWLLSQAYTVTCSKDITEEDLRQAYEQTGERLGDRGFSLEIREFEVKSVEGDRAEVTATVVAHASGKELPFGTSSDPFFDLFVKEGGEWKVADPSC